MDSTKIVTAGDTVTIEYEGTLDSGEVFDSTSHGDHSHPFTFTAGTGEVIAGFDQGVIGMRVGEEKMLHIPPAQAYGEREDELVQDIPRDALPADQEPKVGMMLLMETMEGGKMPVVISAVQDQTVTLDLNHPLAGKTLHFKIKLVSIGVVPPSTNHHH